MSDKKEQDILQNILAREQEIYGYQMNIDNYQAIIDNIKVDVAEDTLQYLNMTSEEIVKNAPADDVVAVADMVFKEKLKCTLQVEKLEQRKAIHVYDALMSRIGKDRYAALVLIKGDK